MTLLVVITSNISREFTLTNIIIIYHILLLKPFPLLQRPFTASDIHVFDLRGPTSTLVGGGSPFANVFCFYSTSWLGLKYSTGKQGVLKSMVQFQLENTYLIKLKCWDPNFFWALPHRFPSSSYSSLAPKSSQSVSHAHLASCSSWSPAHLASAWRLAATTEKWVWSLKISIYNHLSRSRNIDKGVDVDVGEGGH